MKKTYDFSKARRNPYAKRLREQALRAGDRETLAQIAKIRAAQLPTETAGSSPTPKSKRRPRKAARRK
jgi:hypothetical protein